MSSYITSDLHFNHYNILGLEAYNLWKYGYGYIKTIGQYNDMIINNINLDVGERDILYILGDFGFGPCQELKALLGRIKCKNIIFLFGNHDHYDEAQAISMGFKQTLREPYYLPESKGKIILSHYPIYEAMDNPYIAYNIHGHLHSSKLDMANFVNANIAMNGFKPLNLDNYVKSSLGKGRKRQEPWMGEWYKTHQIFLDRDRKDLNLDEKGRIIFGDEGVNQSNRLD